MIKPPVDGFVRPAANTLLGLRFHTSVSWPAGRVGTDRMRNVKLRRRRVSLHARLRCSAYAGTLTLEKRSLIVSMKVSSPPFILSYLILSIYLVCPSPSSVSVVRKPPPDRQHHSLWIGDWRTLGGAVLRKVGRGRGWGLFRSPPLSLFRVPPGPSQRPELATQPE